MPEKLARVRFTFNRTLGVPTWNLPAGRTCPGRSQWCQKHCYATKGNFLYSNVCASHARNWGLTEDLETFVDDAVAEAHRWTAKGHTRIRVHSAGDFYSLDYFRAWLEIARRTPDVQWFTYTRTWRLPSMAEYLSEAELVPNFTLWYSTDPTTSIPSDSPRTAYILESGNYYAPGMPEPNCKKQLDHAENCATCGLCFDKSRRAVTFTKH